MKIHPPSPHTQFRYGTVAYGQFIAEPQGYNGKMYDHHTYTHMYDLVGV